MKKTLFSLIFLTLFIFACNEADKSTLSNTEIATGDVSYDEIDPQKYAENTGDFYDNPDDDVPDNVSNSEESPLTGSDDNIISDEEINKIGKKIIKNANVSVDVNDYKSYIKHIKDTLTHFDCYISTEEESKSSYAIYNTLTIRVKSEQFDSLLNAILTGKGIEVTSKTIYANDITEQYIDIYQRLKAKKLARNKYQEILKKARSINEVLNVMSYINNIQEQIDATQGRLKYIDNQTQYSTITLSITKEIDENIAKTNFWKKIINALKAGWQGILYVILAIFYLWPILILTGIIIFVVKRRKKNKAKNN